MFIVAVVFEIHPEHVDAFRSAIRVQSETSLRQESGCHQFDVCYEADPTTSAPPQCFLYEKYTDRAAFDLHLQTDHFADFDKLVAPMLRSKEVRTWVVAE
ncbi:MAG: putative quinol monooxygenase [Planctomycetota bacterium]